MNAPALNSPLGSQFDAFLFAPIGEDRNGLPLSVVSLLARMDLDPWQEAAGLAGLPAQDAAQKLAGLLAASPVPSMRPSDPETLATRLIALLPRPKDYAARAIGMARLDEMGHPRMLMRGILFAIWLLWLLSIQALFARHDPPGQAVAHTPAPLTAQSAPTIPGK